MKISDMEVSHQTRATKRAGEIASSRSELKTKTILVPVNIVKGQGKALDFAVELSQRWKANLYVMYVYTQLPRVSGPKLVQAVPGIDWERRGQSFNLFNLVDQLRERYPRTFAYFTDNDCPAEAIQSVASRLDADMIIVSAHERGWLEKLLLVYSDADDIARRSTTPVLVFRPKAKES
jgi:nucleotide-binding universal stress UspA family protein